MNPTDEVELVETEPDPSDDFFVWLRAYEVEGLPPVNVGHATSEFLESAHREGDDPDEYFCHGSGGSVGCDVEDAEQPHISGLTFGGPDDRAWSWAFVPQDAAAVLFTDQDGTTTWQRPRDRLVIFPDTVEDDPDGYCTCRFEAIDSEGAVIVSVDLATGVYTDD